MIKRKAITCSFDYPDSLMTVVGNIYFCSGLCRQYAWTMSVCLPAFAMGSRLFRRHLIDSLHTRTLCSKKAPVRTTILLGDKTSKTVHFSLGDAQTFADLTDDHNAIHLDTQNAETSRFAKPIVHGMLSLGYAMSALALFGQENGNVQE